MEVRFAAFSRESTQEHGRRFPAVGMSALMSLSPERVAAANAIVRTIDAKRNLPLGVAAGLAGALLGALAWAAITATTHYQIGFMAIGVAYLVGYGMRRFGSGRTAIFGYVGGALALLGSILGNLLTIYASLATEGGMKIAQLLAIPPADIEAVFTKNFSPMDVLFYGIAAYYGYRSSIRLLTKEEVAALPA